MQDQVFFFFFLTVAHSSIPKIDLSTSSMESALAPLTEHLTCEQCRQILTERIKTLVVQWSVVKVRRLMFFTMHS
jgi:hypothetical protein